MMALLFLLSTLFISKLYADTIQFDGVDGADGYVLLWGTTSGGPYPNYYDLGLSTDLDMSALSLLPDTTYYFVVQAYVEDGMSVYSNEISYNEVPMAPTRNITVIFSTKARNAKQSSHGRTILSKP